MTYSPRSNPDPMQPYIRPEPVPGDECIGACGLLTCLREDCRACESCGAFFDRDTDGATCETYGPTCGDCPAYHCRSECCAPDPDRYRD